MDYFSVIASLLLHHNFHVGLFRLMTHVPWNTCIFFVLCFIFFIILIPHDRMNWAYYSVLSISNYRLA